MAIQLRIPQAIRWVASAVLRGPVKTLASSTSSPCRAVFLARTRERPLPTRRLGAASGSSPATVMSPIVAPADSRGGDDVSMVRKGWTRWVLAGALLAAGGVACSGGGGGGAALPSFHDLTSATAAIQ